MSQVREQTFLPQLVSPKQLGKVKLIVSSRYNNAITKKAIRGPPLPPTPPPLACSLVSRKFSSFCICVCLTHKSSHLRPAGPEGDPMISALSMTSRHFSWLGQRSAVLFRAELSAIAAKEQSPLTPGSGTV